MRDFQAIGASLDAANRDLSAATDCSTKIPLEGFSIKLEYATPQVVPEGKDPRAATHPGMLPLLKRMATIIRTRFTPDFFQGVMDEAIEQLSGEVEIDAEGFTRSLNAARAASGLPPLVSAEGEVAEKVAEALTVYREQWATGQEEFIQGRIRAAIEAHEASQAGAPAPAAAREVGGYDGDPPAPRGGARRRG